MVLYTPGMNRSLAEKWASSLGLIDVPLFRESEEASENHSVLLDGERGSFALSVCQKPEVDTDAVASWIWSADLPHHIVVDEDHVTLSRWDDPTSTRRFGRSSVEDKLEPFYEFLRLDRIRSRRDIVEHSMDLFRRVRSYVNEQDVPDEASINAFLFVISTMMAEQESLQNNDLEQLVSTYALNPFFSEVYRGIKSNVLESLITQFRSPIGSPSKLEMVPQLMVRHASGTVFQEAHYEFLRGAPTNLFGVPGRADIKIETGGGTHFTPPGLARSIVEQALSEIHTDSLTILDPSCGAGAFLHEVLRHLQRQKYQGEVKLCGYDISPNAVAMARFTLAQAARDWPDGRIEEIRIEMRDSLDSECLWSEANVILMNPPFISWGGMDSIQREQVRSMLGETYKGRPDYSMAFIDKALSSVKSGGIVGTLMPASILSLGASLSWRKRLLNQAVPRYLATLGDHALFPHAMIEAAYVIFAKQDDKPNDRIVSLWTSEKRGTTGEALRNLRRLTLEDLQYASPSSLELTPENEWHAYVTSASHLRETPNWRPRPNRIETLLVKLREATQMTVAEIFQVRQGIRTGFRKAFIVSGEEYSQLPKKEKPYFRPVVENKNIRSGRILPRDYVFYPDTNRVDPIRNETDLQRLVPLYHERFLQPNSEDLRARKSLRGRDWWHLSEPRSWLVQPKPKLVSAYFGDAGSFAWDETGEYALIQGFAWLIRSPQEQQELEEFKDEVEFVIDETTIHKAYLALFNSSLFELLLAEFCPRVAGGQYDLSPRFVNHVPVPNLATRGIESPVLGSGVRELAAEGENIHRHGLGSIRQANIDYLVAEVYRVPLESWPETDE